MPHLLRQRGRAADLPMPMPRFNGACAFFLLTDVADGFDCALRLLAESFMRAVDSAGHTRFSVKNLDLPLCRFRSTVEFKTHLLELAISSLPRSDELSVLVIGVAWVAIPNLGSWLVIRTIGVAIAIFRQISKLTSIC